jgi:hypothetical protein
MYYSIIITFIMMSHDDPDETGRPCLRAECHSWYQSITGVIHHVRLYFCKTMVRKCLDAHIRTIVVLIGGKLTGIYFLHLLYSIYYSVTTHLQKGKKVNFLPSADVNPRPIPLRRGLLESSPYHAVGATCLSCDWPRLCT